MSGFELISVDMFQTLEAVDSRQYYIWKRTLDDKYTPELAEEYGPLMSDLVTQYFHKNTVKQRTFSSVESIFELIFNEFFSSTGLNSDSKKAAAILVEEHGLASSYDDTAVFLEAVGKRFPICLVSDADTDMLRPLLKRFDFDHTFVSEELRAYKNDEESAIFPLVIEYYGLDPEKILHIGDSFADVRAGQHGIKTCWLNRNNHQWDRETKPDYIVNSLLEVAEILGFEILP